MNDWLCSSGSEQESEASSFNLNIKTCRLNFTPYSKPRSIVSIKPLNWPHNYSTFVGEANILWPESQMALIDQSFGHKTIHLSLDQAVPKTRNISHATQWGSPRGNLVAYTSSSVRVPKYPSSLCAAREVGRIGEVAPKLLLLLSQARHSAMC